jgi:hypothetical protein
MLIKIDCENCGHTGIISTKILPALLYCSACNAARRSEGLFPAPAAAQCRRRGQAPEQRDADERLRWAELFERRTA